MNNHSFTGIAFKQLNSTHRFHIVLSIGRVSLINLCILSDQNIEKYIEALQLAEA